MATAAERKKHERRRRQIKGWTEVTLVLPPGKRDEFKRLAQQERDLYRQQTAVEPEPVS